MVLALSDLECELEALGLWAVEAPNPAQLVSAQPFCIDTMAFEQWLQWIFITRMRVLADQDLPLPGGCQILPMGEQAFAPLGRRRSDLVQILARIDRLAVDLG